MTITITIELGNDAMQTPGDVAWALRDTAKAIEEGRDASWDRHHDFPILDENGNRVGMFRLEGR